MGKKANWHKAKHGLITKAKISFGLQKQEGRAQTDRRRGEEKKIREGKEEEEGRGVKGRAKRYGILWNSKVLYGFP